MRSSRLRLRLLTILLTTAGVATGASANAQQLSTSVEADVFFEDDPAWILDLRPALGYDSELGIFPQIGVGLGHAFGSHFYLGFNGAARLDVERYLRAGLRLGAFFGDADLTFGTGVTPGIGTFLHTEEWGPLLTWGAESRLRLDHNDFLTIFFEIDLLFEAVGFRQNRHPVSGGIGWLHTF